MISGTVPFIYALAVVRVSALPSIPLITSQSLVLDLAALTDWYLRRLAVTDAALFAVEVGCGEGCAGGVEGGRVEAGVVDARVVNGREGVDD